jgi:hypothetical protein
LLKFLIGKGCEISRPIFREEDPGKVREANQALYVGCDAVILFYGTGDQTWIYQQSELTIGTAQVSELTWLLFVVSRGNGRRQRDESL